MKTNLKRIFACLLASVSLTAFANADFAKKAAYTEGQFKDVKTDAWYAKEVASAYELGFMNGTGADVFSPDGNVTVAQGITMAARVNASYNGKGEIANSTTGNWYDNAVKYAVDNGIITEGQFDDYNRNITRAEMATLFAKAVPEKEFAAKNNVEYIPDVNITADYADELLMLYKAGVVMGSDAYGTFNPDADIKRSEAAAIINRVAIPANRLAKELKEYTARDAYQFVYTDGTLDNNLTAHDGSIRENIVSGWLLDNRGGQAKTSIESVTTSVIDISETQGSALIREFNKIDKDKIVAEFSAVVNSSEAYIEFRDEAGNSAYQLAVVDGNWSILGKDGKFTSLVKAKHTSIENFRLYLDFTSGKSVTFIDNVSYGEHDLLSDNIMNFRFAIDEKGTGEIVPGKINFTANYGVFEIFDTYGLEEAYGWKTEGNAEVNNGELILSGKTNITKKFEAIDVKYIAEMLAIFPKLENAGYKVMSGGTAAIELKSENGALYANGTKVYDLTKNMWYRLRIEANPSAGKADIVVNGRTIANVPLNTTNPVDTLVISSEDGNAKVDNIKVYANADHYDYVPEPATKADLTDWIVAMNVCSLWRDNGTHYGWAVITPYDENKPVLGYYDEGSPESADWEIKFMAEHGIDVQAFCWYADAKTGPLKTPRLSYQLHEGYQLSKYEDYMKYCLIWEAGSGEKFNAQQFRTNVIPYWFENYFLDENYLVIDNKPVLHVYSISTIASDQMFGSIANTKLELDNLENVAKSYGFDGMLYISNGTMGTLAHVGIDANAAYHWGQEGYTYEENVKHNVAGAQEAERVGNVYQIPTISVGYSDYAWRNAKMPLMTKENFSKSHKWVKDTFIPTYAEKGTWQEKMVWLSTWNEYGEGTYIMPVEALHGFDYLDVIREEYTNLEGTHEDAVPTDAQAERIQHLYPQYARHLRRQGYYEDPSETKAENAYEVVKTITFSEGSTINEGFDVTSYNDGAISGKSTDLDFKFTLKDIAGFDITDVKQIRIKCKIPAGNYGVVYFSTETNPNLAEDKKFSIRIDDSGMKEYVIDTKTNENWTGKLRDFRFDPAQAEDIEFSVASIEFLVEKKAEASDEILPENYELYVNGQKIESIIKPEMPEDEILFPFDPETAIHYIMHSFINWNHDEKVLTIEANNHKVVYTVGSDKYTVDGKEKSLGYTLYQTDGLPMLSYKTLAQAFGFTYKTENGKVYVETPEKDLYGEDAVKTAWEFNTFGTEGWTSGSIDLFSNGEYLRCDNSSKNNNDPNMSLTSGLGFSSEKYNSIEIKMRYKYESSHVSEIAVYFITSIDKTWNEAKKKAAYLKSKDSNGEWEIYTLDMSSKPTWFGYITALRVDPFNNANGYAEIDYIRLVENPDYDEENAIDFHGIINGDAENTKLITMTSPSSTISIVEDELNPGNHVYRAVAPDSKIWTYMVHSYPFEAGKTYRISFDARAVSDSKGSKVNQRLSVNIQYPSAEGNDHGAGDLYLTADGQWHHFEKTYNIGKMLSTEGAAFSCYITPPSENTSGVFELDNLVVEEVE